jgi:hypothetical protein
MHPFFKSLAITNTLGLQVSLMDIHHDTSLKSILEDDFISSTSKIHIRFCSGKGAKLWLITRPYICLFHITHSTFISMLHFHLSLIQPLAFSLLTCEYEHGLDTSSIHLTHCPFGGQRIPTHDVIQDIMYALV